VTGEGNRSLTEIAVRLFLSIRNALAAKELQQWASVIIAVGNVENGLITITIFNIGKVSPV
jgi:hypothetical protein